MPPPVSSVLLTTDAVGGVWTHALDLARGLVAREVQVTLAVMGPRPSAAQAEAARAAGSRLLVTDLPLDWAGADEEALRAAGRSLASLAANSGAALVHLNSPALAAGGDFAMPLVIGCHSCVATWWDTMRGTPLPEEFARQRALVAAGYAAADALVAPSRAFARMTAEQYDLRRMPRVVHNARPSRPMVHGARDGILAAGRLWDEAKNIALLDRIAPRLDAPILVAGPLAAPHGGTARFPKLWHLGALDSDAMAKCLAAHAIFVSPARYEPFGLAVLEAAQAGCALVLSDIASFREIWGDAAIYVAPDDEEGFLQALRTLSADPELRAQRGAAARKRAGLYTEEAMVEGMLGLYRELLPHHSPLESAA
ncbi:glycosyltransferase [Roseococcus sp. SYP-B2431]|uniref:glycosyltransferase family 4 protein n=1 Tax=Roseococcus sp. SYP-B2431 TaxID=2496640 RepID=UPI00103FA6AF|nr:glycosyltransferase family 4 protein [Roseococcus sp. SYP-B2431]TCH98137.1 glycosyltransferase [Roseococcus sp. SYP-B2431]